MFSDTPPEIDIPLFWIIKTKFEREIRENLDFLMNNRKFQDTEIILALMLSFPMYQPIPTGEIVI
jgi:hypothetical protein